MTCKFCNGWGYIEICEGIGPRVDCPHCVEKEVEVDAGELACETTPTINVTDPDAVITELAEAKELSEKRDGV